MLLWLDLVDAKLSGPTDNIWIKRQTVAGPWWMPSSRGPTVNWNKEKSRGLLEFMV